MGAGRCPASTRAAQPALGERHDIYASHVEATTDITDYIDSVRLHSKLGNLPPNAFEQQSAVKQLSALYGKTWSAQPLEAAM